MPWHGLGCAKCTFFVARGWCVSPSHMKHGGSRLLLVLDYMVSIYYSVYAQTCDYGDIHHAIYAEIR